MEVMSSEDRNSVKKSVDRFYSESNQKYLREVADDIRSGTAHFERHDLIEKVE